VGKDLPRAGTQSLPSLLREESPLRVVDGTRHEGARVEESNAAFLPLRLAVLRVVPGEPLGSGQGVGSGLGLRLGLGLG
jgi:hypothetical protein